MDFSKKKGRELLDQFCTVTGAGRDVGKNLLEACDGNLQLAVDMHMEGGGASSSIQEDSVRAPIPQTQEILVDDPVYAVNFRGRKRKARSVFDGFRDFQEEARQQEEQMLARASGSGSGSRSGFSRKTKTLQDLFRPPIDLTYKGTFANARDHGSTQGKWLMVNIQNVQEFVCQALNRDVWSNAAVKSVIRDNFIFWQVYHDSEEGEKYTQFYKVDEWPYVAVLDPQTGEKLVTWSNIDSITFCDLVTEFLAQHPTMDSLSPVAKRTKREDSLVDASEDDQLDAAIKASLTDVQKPKPQTVKEENSESDSDTELETFTDSDENSQLSPIKSKKLETESKSQRKTSPSRSKKGSPSHRSNSPCTSYSDNESVQKRKSRRSCSPASKAQPTARNLSPKSASTSKCSSPKRSCSPLCPKTSSPAKKSDSIHNNVHPAVIENVKRQEGSEECESTDKSSENEECVTSDSVVSADDSVSLDTRDYRNYLGKETDEKATLMLRFPDGEREKMSIPFSSKLLAVVLFANSKGFSNERYELVAHFPVRQLSQLDFDSTLKESGLNAQETIFVQKRS